jgi:hypothetical protein
MTVLLENSLRITQVGLHVVRDEGKSIQLKTKDTIRRRWLTSVILVTQEAEIRGTQFKASPGK